MAKIKGLDKFKKELISAAKEIQSISVLREIGNETAERIKVRTQSGKGVSENNKEATPLKKLKRSYIEQRKKKKSELSPKATPSRSNLTRTGQMLESMKVTSVKIGSVTIGPSGSRTDSDLNNKEVAGYVSLERPFLNLSRAELNGLTRLIHEKLNSILGRILKK